ncbi:MAG TPA: FKBP-type peptidyl-prolyl cis-trans isomerase [Gemmataceae bacterium]|nr:FKBP-type peptidyl-prolyl cis-trans isomerase [Gemmataceae bacterium]
MFSHFRIFLGVSICFSLIPAACAPPPKEESKQNTPEEKMITTPSGLKFVEVKEGTGEAAKLGDIVEIHYTGWLADKTQFDTSKDRGEPITFQIGSGLVIQGWDVGIAGMKAGGKRKLIIPPALAYGAEGKDEVIPPNAELTFEVELVKIEKEP